MNWLGGKLSKPAFQRMFGYLQSTYPDAQVTTQVASLATADNPMAPSDDDPFAVVAAAPDKSVGPRSWRDRASGLVQTRAKSYALSKTMSLVWKQVMMPLTIVLWGVKLLLAWVEGRRIASALQFKTDSTHDADVARVVHSIQLRPPSHMLASRRLASLGHMMRSNDAKKEMGPASAIAAASESTAATPLHLIDLSRLNCVRSIDVESETCVVQAACTFRNLLRASLHSHLMPAVVPPYLDMTVGGAVVGSAIGSTSWRHGAFSDSVIEMELALGSGEVISVTRDGQHAALFHAVHSSYHSIATVTSVTIRMVRAPRYVWMRYQHFTSCDQAVSGLQSLLQTSHPQSLEDLEAIVFSPTSVTVCMTTGVDAIDTSKHKVVTCAHWWEQPYAVYVQKCTQRAQRGAALPVKHCIPMMDFLARYEMGAFWQSSFFYSQLPWPLNGNSFMSRLLLGWCVGERNLRGCVESSQMHARFERTRIVQDAQVPLHHLAPFLNWTLSDVGVSPMWLCPVLGSESDVLAPNYVHIGSAHNSALGFHYVNVGCYGRPTNSQLPHADLQAAFIQNVYQAGGRTLLHAHNWHTPHLWSQMFNRKPYDAVRKKYGATEAYPHAYDKVSLRESDRAALNDASDSDPASESVCMRAMTTEMITRKFKFWVS